MAAIFAWHATCYALHVSHDCWFEADVVRHTGSAANDRSCNMHRDACRLNLGAQRPVVRVCATAEHLLQASSNDNAAAAHTRAFGGRKQESEAARHEACMLAQLQDSVLQNQPLAVVASHDDKHPRRRFAFHSRACCTAAAKARALVVSEHCDGAKFCESLFGHFLLPNGRLAHFYYKVRPCLILLLPGAHLCAGPPCAYLCCKVQRGR